MFANEIPKGTNTKQWMKNKPKKKKKVFTENFSTNTSHRSPEENMGEVNFILAM